MKMKDVACTIVVYIITSSMWANAGEIIGYCFLGQEEESDYSWRVCFTALD